MSYKTIVITGMCAVLGLGLSGCFSKEKQFKNTLRLATPAKIKGLDPAHSDDMYSGIEVSRAYEGLLQYHYLKRPYELEANLAESMPTISKDGKTYTFKIRKGVLFQDDPCFKTTEGKGRELNASDFVYSWKRLADPKTVSTGWWILDGKLVGLNAWRDEASKSGAADYTQDVEGLRALDAYTLQLKLVSPSAQILYNIAQQFAFAVPHEAVEFYGKELLNHAVGTGPFQLVEFNGASKVIWKKNPTFRQQLYPSEGASGDREAGLLVNAGQPIPFVDGIVTTVFEESQPAWLNFLAQKLDASAIPKDNFNQAISESKGLVEELKAKGIVLHKAPTLDVTHQTFNMADPVVGRNKYLRQALSMSIDRAQIIELFHNGRGISAQTPIPPGVSGYDEAYKNPYVQYDVAKAKELLVKAGFPGGKGLPELEYSTMADTTSRQMSDALAKSFDVLGVKLKVNSYSWPEFQRNIREKKGQIWGMAWGADYPDAENFLQLLYSKNSSPGPNDANYSNAEFDRLYEKSLTLMESPARTILYKKMAQLIVEDCPWIFEMHRLSFGLTQPWLKNYKPHDFDHARAKYYRLSK